jgi:predicted flap endonuclease-1-like 5' DNA nuclease
MWDQTFKRWIDLVYWWLPKHKAKQTAPQARTSAPKASEPGVHRTPKQAKQAGAGQAASATAPDDLTVIKGIGPAVQKKLHALGIRTFDDLAAADPAKLAEQLKGRQPVSPAAVRGWTKAANQRTARH